MADNINFILSAQDKVTETVKSINSSFDNLGKEVGLKSKEMTKALQGIGLAAGAFLGLSVKAAIDEETAINNAARATAKAAGGFDIAKKQIADFSKQMEEQGFSTEKTTEAITLLVNKAGKDLPTAMSMAADLIAGTEAQGISLAQGIKRITGEESENQKQLEETNKALIANKEEIAEYQKKLEELASQSTLTTEEQRKFRDLNISLERANRTVQEASEKVAIAQNDVNDAIKKYGPNSKEAESAQQKLIAASKQLASANERAGDIQLRISDATADVASRQGEGADKASEYRAKISELSKEQNDLIASTNDLTLAVQEDGKAFEGQAELRAKTEGPAERLAKTQERIGDLMEKIGEKLLPVVEKVLEFVNILLDGFDQLDPGVQDFLVTLGTVVGVILAVAGAVSTFISIAGPVIGLIQGIVTVLGAFFGAIIPILGAIAAFATGIGEIIAVIVLVIAIIAVLKTAWDENWFGIQETVQEVSAMIGGILTFLIDSVTAFIQNFVDTFIIGTINFIVAMAKFIIDVNDMWNNFINGLVLNLVAGGLVLVAEVKKFLDQITDNFNAIIAKAYNWGVSLISRVISGIKSKIGEIANIISSAVSGAAGEITSKIPKFADGGVVTSPTLAMVGEGGEPEAIIPLSKLDQIGGNRGPVTMTFNIREVSDPKRIASLVGREVMRTLGASDSDVAVSSRGYS